MTVAETYLVLVGIPLAVILVLALLTLPGGRKRLRYKPGQPWDHAPVWYEPHPEAGGHDGGHHADGHRALEAGARADAGPLGGARGTW